MQTFKKLFVFMLIASAMAPALAMERVAMTEEAAGKENEPTVREIVRNAWGNLVAKVRRGDEKTNVQAPVAVVAKAVTPVAVVVEEVPAPVAEVIEEVAPVAIVAKAVTPVAVVVEEAAPAPVVVAEAAPVKAIVVEQSVAVNRIASAKSQARPVVSGFDAIKAIVVKRFQFLERLLPGRINAPVKQDSLSLSEEAAPLLQIEDGQDFIGPVVATPVVAVAEEAAPVVVAPASIALPESDDESEAEEVAPVVEHVATPAPVQVPAESQEEDADITSDDFADLFSQEAAPTQDPAAEAARLAEILVAAQAALAAVPADAANRPELQAAVDAAQAAVNAAANPGVVPAQKTFAGKAKDYVSAKAKAVKDFYAFDENAKVKSAAKYAGTAAIVAAIAGGSYALYNYIFADEKSVEEVKAPEAPVKTTVAEAPVAKPAVSNSGSRSSWHCKKHCSKRSVRVKCRGKKSCSSNGCK